MVIPFIIAGAGIVGVALLLQSKPGPLPTREEYDKAFDRWAKDSGDKDAILIMGKYLAFVEGDYKGGFAFLSNSSDPVLSKLAGKEIIPEELDTPQKQVAMGDEWVAAGKKIPALSRIFNDRANQWFITAWPNIDKASRPKLRERGLKLAVSRPPGDRKAIPSGWALNPGIAGRPAVLDGNVARTGSYSVRIPPADEKVAGSGSAVASDTFPLNGKTVEASAYVLTDGTEDPNDSIYVHFYDKDKKYVGNVTAKIQPNVPFWNRVVVKGDIPAGATTGMFSAGLFSKKGPMWMDDASVKIDGKEVLKNASFEDR